MPVLIILHVIHYGISQISIINVTIVAAWVYNYHLAIVVKVDGGSWLYARFWPGSQVGCRLIVLLEVFMLWLGDVHICAEIWLVYRLKLLPTPAITSISIPRTAVSRQ